MAKIPTVEALGERPAPQPSMGVARYNPVSGAEQAIPDAIGSLSENMVEIDREMDRIDKLRAEDAFNQLLDVKTDLTVGEKNGFVNHKGGDAISRPLEQQYTGRLESSINEIGGKLNNDRQRDYFRRRASVATMQLKEDVLKHKYAEGQKYEATTIENTNRVELQNISTKPTDPTAFEMSITRMQGVIDSSSFSPEQKELMRSKMLTTAHTTVIENALAKGDDLYAKTWFKENQKEIFDPDGSLAKKVETNSSIIEAGRAVDDVWGKLGPRSDTSPLDMADMDKELRKRYADNPTVLKASRAELEIRANTRNNAVKERENFNLSTVSKMIAEGGDITSVRQSKSFQRLDGVQQLRVLDYLKQRSKGIENITESQFADYVELSQPQNLDKMSTEAVESLVFSLGPELTDRLLKKKELYAKEPEAKVDTEDFNHFIRGIGVEPTDKDNKPRVGELQYQIENRINAEQNNKGRKLTRDEKQSIISHETTQVMLKRPLWFDKKRALGELTPEDMERAYVNLEEVPPQAMVTIRKRAADLGLKITDRHIERAYFMKLRGFSGSAIDQYLKGTP